MPSSPYTLTECETFFENCKKSYSAVLQGQEYETDIGGGKVRLRRSDADWIKKQMDYWAKAIAERKGRNRKKFKFGVVRDL